MSAENATEKLLTPAQAAQLLRELANNLEQGNLEFGQVAVELDDFFKVKQSVRTKSDRVCFKLKLKYEKRLYPAGHVAKGIHPLLESDQDDEDEAPEGRRIGYKPLKKSMGRAFKDLLRSLALGADPDLDKVKAFCAQCYLMTSFPGKGDEHYGSFRSLTDRLLAAAQNADQKEALAAAMAMEEMKKACHARHK